MRKVSLPLPINKLQSEAQEVKIFAFFHNKPDSIFSFAGHMVSVESMQLCICKAKAVVDNM